MQAAEIALERRVAIPLVMPCGIDERVPGGMRERGLLAEQQDDDVDEAGQSTSCHREPGYAASAHFCIRWDSRAQ